MSFVEAERPIPEPTTESRPYWDGLKGHRLLFQRCVTCQTLRHYPRPVCDNCFSSEYDWLEATGQGKVYSWTVNHHAFHHAFKNEVPFITVTVDMEEGVRMQAPLTIKEPKLLSIGLAVRVMYDDINKDLTLPRFHPL